MADGTTGLGQNQTVFDFSGIAQMGLQMDELARQRSERKSDKYKASNKDIMNEVSKVGIREVDKPFINDKYNEWMSTASEAMRTEDPAVTARARQLRSELSEVVATSQGYQKSYINGIQQMYGSDSYKNQPSMYEERLNWYNKNTAMTKDNGGQVGDAGIFFHEDLTDFAEKDVSTWAKEAVSAVKQAGTVDSYYTKEDGTKVRSVGVDKDKALANIDKQWDDFLTRQNSDDLLFENYLMSEYKGRSSFSSKEVAAMQERRKYGRELNSKYSDIKELEAAPEFRNNPIGLANAKKAFTMETEMSSMGKEVFTNAVMADIEGTRRTESKSSAGSGTDDTSKYGLYQGTDWTSVLPNVSLENVSEEAKSALRSRGSVIGTSSTKGGALRSIGKGQNTVYYEGISSVLNPDGTETYFLNKLEPSADQLQQLLDKQAEGVTGKELLDFIDFETKVVPLGAFEGDIPVGELKTMKSGASSRAKALRQQLLDEMDAEANS